MNLAPKVPILIIGTGRSGTNFLAHVFEQDPRFWNSYENRYIWNYGQRTPAHDVRWSEEATPQVKRYIRDHFQKLTERKGCIIIDKTLINIFGLGFVHAVFPEAKIIHIVRDGRDSVLSRRYQWFGGHSVAAQRDAGRAVRYRLALIRQKLWHLSGLLRRGNLPVGRWPAFLHDNAVPFVAHLLGGEPRRWGERFPGLRESLDAYGLLVTSAIQWREGVMHALCEGRRLPDGTYMELKYEELLSAPEETWCRIAEFLGMEEDGQARDWLVKQAKRDNFGKWRTELSEEQLRTLEPHIRPTLEYLGYPWE